MRRGDTETLITAFSTLKEGSLDAENQVSCNNCVQLYRLLQLAIEYLEQLLRAHMTLIAAREQAVTIASGWKVAAHQYLGAAGQLLEHYHRGQDCSALFHEADSHFQTFLNQQELYDQVLDQLELKERPLRVTFRRHRLAMNWKQLFALDVNRIMDEKDLAELERAIPVVLGGNVQLEDPADMRLAHFKQVVPLAQCVLDYCLFMTNETGVLQEQWRDCLTAACQEIPQLTTAVEDMREHCLAIQDEIHMSNLAAARRASPLRSPNISPHARRSPRHSPRHSPKHARRPSPATKAEAHEPLSPSRPPSSLSGTASSVMGSPQRRSKDVILQVVGSPARQEASYVRRKVEELAKDLNQERQHVANLGNAVANIQDMIQALQHQDHANAKEDCSTCPYCDRPKDPGAVRCPFCEAKASVPSAPPPPQEGTGTNGQRGQGIVLVDSEGMRDEEARLVKQCVVDFVKHKKAILERQRDVALLAKLQREREVGTALREG